MKFEDTKLLDHPTVRQAYDATQRRYLPATTALKQELRAGEVLSTQVKNPDPDAVAACVLMWPDELKDFSAKAAEYAQQYLDEEDVQNPVLRSEGAKQVMLAHSIVELKDIAQRISNGKAWKYAITRSEIDKNKKNILAAADAAEQPLAQAALDLLQATSTALESLARRIQTAAVFEKSGLPEHPVLREAYAFVRAQETKIDPFFTNKSEFGTAIAKVLIETGASSDPDILGAALLNQFGEKRDGALSKKLPARLIKIYRDTTPFHRASKKGPPSAEHTLILHAIYVHALEAELQDYSKSKSKYSTYGTLENMESVAEDLAEMVPKEAHPALKARMEKAIALANAAMNAPESLKIRKPGTPPREPGW